LIGTAEPAKAAAAAKAQKKKSHPIDDRVVLRIAPPKSVFDQFGHLVVSY